ncbi:hypothetical protein ABID28_000599 [Streptococcus porcorum]|uniref:Transposase n=1 Tax=Streptococcus porcorum TaxID=701526 RepID=A0ABV2JFF7_9STRE
MNTVTPKSNPLDITIQKELINMTLFSKARKTLKNRF